MTTLRTKKTEIGRLETTSNPKTPTSGKGIQTRSLDKSGIADTATESNGEKKQNTQTIHDDDEEVSEIPKSMALGSGLKPGSRRASQALEKTAERANKEISHAVNSQRPSSEAVGHQEEPDLKGKLPQGLLNVEFPNVGAAQGQNPAMLNFPGYFIFMVPSGNGVSNQAATYPGMSQMGYPFLEFMYPQQLGMLGGAAAGGKPGYQQELLGRLPQIPPELLNGQFAIIQQQDPMATEETSKQLKKMEEETRISKTSGKKEKPSPLDGNILSEKEISKVNQTTRKSINETSPNKLAQNKSESNSVAEENAGGRSLNAEVSFQGSTNNSARSRRARVCFNRYCQTDPANPALWSKNKLEGKMICKMCDDGWKKGQFCFFCHQIYVDNDKYCSDGTDWISCDKCAKWTHLACEEKPIQRKIKTANDRNEEIPYYCPKCRSSATSFGGANSRKIVKKQLNIPATSKFVLSSNPEINTYSKANMYSLRKLDRASNQAQNEDDEDDRKSKNRDQESGEDKTEAQQKNKSAASQKMEEEEEDDEDDEVSQLQRKLDSLLQRRRVLVPKTGTNFENFTAFETLLGQHGKKLKIPENELMHDLQLMRGEIKDDISTNQNSEKKMQEESDEEAQSGSNLEPEESKASSKGGDRSALNHTRPARNKAKQLIAAVTNGRSVKTLNTTVPQKDTNNRHETNTVANNGGNQPKRQTRSRAKIE